jgi:hypothetical protein
LLCVFYIGFNECRRSWAVSKQKETNENFDNRITTVNTKATEAANDRGLLRTFLYSADAKANTAVEKAVDNLKKEFDVHASNPNAHRGEPAIKDPPIEFPELNPKDGDKPKARGGSASDSKLLPDFSTFEKIQDSSAADTKVLKTSADLKGGPSS